MGRNVWNPPLPGVEYCDHKIHLQVNTLSKPDLPSVLPINPAVIVRAFCSLCGMAGKWIHPVKKIRVSPADERKAISDFYKAALHYEKEPKKGKK